MLAAASCSSVPTCILLAVRARVRLAAACCCDPYTKVPLLHDDQSCFLWHASLRHPAGPPHGEPCAYSYICAIFGNFSLISLRTRTVRTNAKEVDRGRPSGHKIVVEVWTPSVQCRAWRALKLFRREWIRLFLGFSF